MSNVLDGPSWGASSSAKLVSQKASRHTGRECSSPFERTLRPFGQTYGMPSMMAAQPRPTRPPDETIRPRLESRQSRQVARELEPCLKNHPPRKTRQPVEEQHEARNSPMEQLSPPPQKSQLRDPRRCFQDPVRSSPPVHDRPHVLTRQPSGSAVVRSPPAIPLNHTMEPFGSSSNPHSRQVQEIRPPKSRARPHPDYQEVLPTTGSKNGSKPVRPVSNHRGGSTKAQKSPQDPVESLATPAVQDFRHITRAHTGSSSSSSENFIELSPSRRREIISRVNESVQSVMASMLSDTVNKAQWKFKLHKKDISYYTDETCVKPEQKRFCCVSHSHAPVEELMKLFVVADTDTMARNNRVVSDTLLETRVLSVLRRPTPQRPMNSMFISYLSYHTPGLMMDREICVAVGTDMIRQSDGSVVGYCLWDTVDGPEFAEATNKFEASVMFRSGFFFRRAGPRHSSSGESCQEFTKIVYLVGFEPGGWVPGITARLLMEKFGMNLIRLCAHFRRKQLDSRTFVLKAEWPSKVSVKSCKHCKKQFLVLSKRTNCHACGHIVCKACVSKELVELHAVGLVPMHICYSCLEKNGLPPPMSSQKPWGSYGRRRLHSDTSAISRVATQHPPSHSQPHYQQSTSVVDCDLVEGEEEDSDTDTDTGEWAFTLSGVPIRPYRMAS
uniref:FYVE-type domain-containing protein n=1 Tax=Hyaloperonospora arabidopsidis (strain Emoy2) TaxID=559515 RepID=M4B9S7_HYAAE